MVRELHTRTEFGKAFHNFGAQTQKALSPVLYLVLCSLSNSCDDDRRVLLGLYGITQGDKTGSRGRDRAGLCR